MKTLIIILCVALASCTVSKELPKEPKVSPANTTGLSEGKYIKTKAVKHQLLSDTIIK